MIRHCAVMITLGLLSTSAKADFGRLFFTPEKRAALDHARRHQLSDHQIEKPPTIALEGILHGPAGVTLWVNGQPVKNQTVTAGMNIRAGQDIGRAEVQPAGKPAAKSHAMKVGETLRTTPQP